MKASPTSSSKWRQFFGSPGESGNRHSLPRCESSSQRCWRGYKKRLADALRAAYAQADAAVCTIQAAYYRYHKKVSPRYLSVLGHPPATIVTPDLPTLLRRVDYSTLRLVGIFSRTDFLYRRSHEHLQLVWWESRLLRKQNKAALEIQRVYRAHRWGVVVLHILLAKALVQGNDPNAQR